MRQREAKTGRKAEAADLPYLPPTEVVENDINRFIRSHGHLPDVPLQEESLLMDIQQIMDNELLNAVNRVLRHWNWCQPDGVRQRDLDEVFPLEELRMKLEDLQKARMRDVVVVKLKPVRN